MGEIVTALGAEDYGLTPQERKIAQNLVDVVADGIDGRDISGSKESR